jgi:hypothetical protein
MLNHIDLIIDRRSAAAWNLAMDISDHLRMRVIARSTQHCVARLLASLSFYFYLAFLNRRHHRG